MSEQATRERRRELLDRYLPVSEKYAGPVVHRSFVIRAFEAGLKAAVSPELDVSIDEDTLLDLFEEYADEEFIK